MKAAVFYQPHKPVSIEEIELDSIRNDEVLLDTMAAGVCHSDYHLVDGHRTPRATPWVMGHEGAGVVGFGDGNLAVRGYWRHHSRIPDARAGRRPYS